MKIFIGWSGDKGKRIAELLQDWIPTIFHRIEPRLSEADMADGKWNEELVEDLWLITFGIICVEPSSLHSQSLNFEAGALTGAIERKKIVTFLLGIDEEEVTGPLSHFNFVSFDKKSIKDMIFQINASSSKPIEEDRLEQSFEHAWPSLKEGLNNIELINELPGDAPEEKTGATSKGQKIKQKAPPF